MPYAHLIPQVLVQVSVRDLLQRLDVVHRQQVRVEVHELDANLLEGSLCQQVALDARQSLVGIVVSLLGERMELVLRMLILSYDELLVRILYGLTTLCGLATLVQQKFKWEERRA